MKESLHERPVQLARNFVADLGSSEPQMSGPETSKNLGERVRCRYRAAAHEQNQDLSYLCISPNKVSLPSIPYRDTWEVSGNPGPV